MRVVSCQFMYCTNHIPLNWILRLESQSDKFLVTYEFIEFKKIVIQKCTLAIFFYRLMITQMIIVYFCQLFYIILYFVICYLFVPRFIGNNFTKTRNHIKLYAGQKIDQMLFHISLYYVYARNLSEFILRKKNNINLKI